MRGVVSAGMTAALERLGLTRCFDLVVGSSAGALNAAALLGGSRPAGGARCTTRCWRRGSSSTRCGCCSAGPRSTCASCSRTPSDRPRRRAPRADDRQPDPAALRRARRRQRASRVEFTGMRTKDELWQVLLATTRMPWVGGAARADRRPPLHRRRADLPDPDRDAVDAGRDARARAADPPLRRAAVGRRAGSASALIARHLRRAEPRARAALARARRRLRGPGRRTSRAGREAPERRRPVRARPAPARGHAGGDAARAPAGGARRARRATPSGLVEVRSASERPIGLGLAALGPARLHQPRPRRRPRRGPQPGRRCARRTHAVLDHAYAARGPVLRRGAVVRPRGGVPRRLAARARRPPA